MINKNDIILNTVDKYPEVATVLSAAGLHCIGCHASGSETIKEGCLAHGLNEKEIDNLIIDINKKIKEYDSKTKITFTNIAIKKLKEKLIENKSKFIRITPIFGGVDFETVDKKFDLDVELLFSGLTLITDSKTERLIRGIRVDYSSKDNDFVVVD